MATSPSLIGYSVFAVLWAKVSVPTPASFEKIALLTPVMIVSLTDSPRTPLSQRSGQKLQKKLILRYRLVGQCS